MNYIIKDIIIVCVILILALMLLLMFGCTAFEKCDVKQTTEYSCKEKEGSAIVIFPQ